MKFDKLVSDLVEAYEAGDETSPIAWIVSQTWLPYSGSVFEMPVVDVIGLEHERRAKRFNSPEEAKRRVLSGDVVLIPDPKNQKMLKIYYTNWDSS